MAEATTRADREPNNMRIAPRENRPLLRKNECNGWTCTISDSTKSKLRLSISSISGESSSISPRHRRRFGIISKMPRPRLLSWNQWLLKRVPIVRYVTRGRNSWMKRSKGVRATNLHSNFSESSENRISKKEWAIKFIWRNLSDCSARIWIQHSMMPLLTLSRSVEGMIMAWNLQDSFSFRCNRNRSWLSSKSSKMVCLWSRGSLEMTFAVTGKIK